MTAIAPERVETPLETQDPNEVAHIVMVPAGEPDESPQAYVTRARVEGFAVTAVCGYTWTPYRSAAGLPVCPPCREFWETNGRDLADRAGRLPDE